MPDVVTLERVLPASASRVFAMITTPEQMVRWWGHADMIVPEHDLDFSRPGPWYAVMEQPDGRRLMVSGTVTDVDPPRFIAFTWAWHEGGPGGPRGTETNVTIEISAAGQDRATMILRHFDLGTDDARAGHARGWLAIFDKLERGLA
jgi:uncharacterized protein YndB with AHSA1/START domain